MTAESGALVSVLMPCCGQLEYTRLSVPRMLRHSRPPFEVVFIDAASLDGTAEYLEGVAAGAPARVEVVRGEREEDFAALVEEAVRRARGPLAAWLNNDVLVPELWLQQLAALVTANESIGLVGPMSNLAPEIQRVASVPYRLARPRPFEGAAQAVATLETAEVDGFAQQLRQRHQGQWGELERVGGFCWLAKRQVLERSPLLEIGAEAGVFDAERFCARAREAGFRLAYCRDLFVHHFGGNVRT